MKRTILLAVLLISFFGQVWAEETKGHHISSVPSDSRYEIIQSELTPRITLKVDKYTGKVFQLVRYGGELSWKLITARRHSKDKVVANTVNYQLFTSGFAVSMTFLINVNTGASWQLIDSDGASAFWQIME